MNVKTKNLGVDAGIMAYIPVPAGYDNNLGLLVKAPAGQKYRLEMDKVDEGAWGVRVARSRIIRDNSVPDNLAVVSKTGWLLISDPCYIHDNSILNYEKVFEMHDGAIYEEEHGRWGVTSSGFGDGGYDCTAVLDENGLLIEAYVEFISEENDDENDYDDENDEEE